MLKRMKKIILVLLAVDLIGALVVCGLYLKIGSRDGSSPAAPENSIAEGAEAEPSGEGSAAASAEGEAAEEVLSVSTTLAFTGDILLDERVTPNYDAGGISGLLDETMLSTLTDADITMVNEEFPFSTRGIKAEDKQYTFRVDPAYVTAFQDMGVDLVSLANNHSLDFGKDALRDTFAALDAAGIRYAGAGESVERAQALQAIEVNGKTFGFLAASRVIPVTDWNVANQQPGVFCTYDDTQLLEEIRKAKESCDFVTVFVHWGKEKTTQLEEHQTELAHDYIDAGADLVIGAHPHILQGIEYYRGKPIFYSLGNFIFGQSNEQTAALRVTVDEEGTVTCCLTAAYASGGKTCAMDEDSAQQLYAMLSELSEGVAIEPDGTVHHR